MTEGVKILEKDKQFFVLKTLNSLSPRSFSFTVFVGGEKFINPFLKFLNSFNKNTKVL
jgi:hypothetical protein